MPRPFIRTGLFFARKSREKSSKPNNTSLLAIGWFTRFGEHRELQNFEGILKSAFSHGGVLPNFRKKM